MGSRDTKARAAGAFRQKSDEPTLLDPASPFASATDGARSNFLSNPEIDGFLFRSNMAVNVLNFPSSWTPIETHALPTEPLVFGTVGSPLDHSHCYTKSKFFLRDVLTFVTPEESVPEGLAMGGLFKDVVALLAGDGKDVPAALWNSLSFKYDNEVVDKGDLRLALMPAVLPLSRNLIVQEGALNELAVSSSVSMLGDFFDFWMTTAMSKSEVDTRFLTEASLKPFLPVAASRETDSCHLDTVFYPLQGPHMASLRENLRATCDAVVAANETSFYAKNPDLLDTLPTKRTRSDSDGSSRSRSSSYEHLGAFTDFLKSCSSDDGELSPDSHSTFLKRLQLMCMVPTFDFEGTLLCLEPAIIQDDIKDY